MVYLARPGQVGIPIGSSGDTLFVSPPLIVTKDQIEIFPAIRRALNAIG